MHTKTKGDITEVIILADLVKRELKVLAPFGEHSRYDLVVDVSGKFIRLQCKTGRLRNGVIKFSTASSVNNFSKKPGRKTYTNEEIDLFGVYCFETNKVYYIPISICNGSQMDLRVEPTKNNQNEGIHYAVDFENWPL